MPVSEATRRELLETFKTFDSDGSGTVSATELAKSIKMMPGGDDIDEALCEDIISLADDDGDRQMNFEEFLRLIEQGMELNALKNPDVDYIAEEFKTFDVNGDGAIDKSELREVMKRLGEEPTEAELDEMFREADADNDGSITLAEFKDLLGH